MNSFTRRLLFGFFFLSGFSSLVYQVVWTRLAFASFGIIAPVLSVVLSVFMLGLAVGSWAGGRLIVRFTRRTGWSPIFFYGLAELIIGLGALVVPALFHFGENLLSGTGQMNSFGYLVGSAVALTVSIFPWCVCMGATFPLMMAYVRQQNKNTNDSFSFLYVANVLGAMFGTVLTAIVLVELLGFEHTLWVAACGNFLIAIGSISLGIAQEKKPAEVIDAPQMQLASAISTDRVSDRMILAVLFSTGFVSMAMEVVWSRSFAGVLKTQVYSFALILFAYLLATFLGSAAYRRNVRLGRIHSLPAILCCMAIAALLPVVMIDPSLTVQQYREQNINPPSAALLLGSIIPLCALMGYLTPGLIDKFSAGEPRRAGAAYAANVIGCILGPLVACYFLLPQMSCRHAMILLAVPFVIFWLSLSRPQFTIRIDIRRSIGALLVAMCFAYTMIFSRDFEEGIALGAPGALIRRDNIASVAAFGKPPMNMSLVVNGVGITILTPITKFIAHLPLVLHRGPSKSALVICFGMGTTYRSALTWGVDTTAVELVPSVPQMFSVYHPDAARFIKDPNGHIIIDDGRRYLSRCGKKFDVITVDPPPPVEAAGSSLLFSTEFYTLAKEHLNTNGIVQMWYPGSPDRTGQAVARSMYESFPYVRCFGSVDGWGMHLVGSMQPIEIPTTDQIGSIMPAMAMTDAIEWSHSETAVGLFKKIFDREIPMTDILNNDLSVQITDDRPLNEYYLLRQITGENR